MILTGDCRETLRTLPDGSVHCVVTSPPYFALRDYQTGTWEGGDPACDHAPRQDWVGDGGDLRRSEGALAGNAAKAERRRGGVCACGAERVDRQLGLEPTPERYVAELVEIFREVRRVLRDDGTFWLNIGDSYSTNPKGSLNGQDKSGLTSTQTQQQSPVGIKKTGFDGIKKKDRLMIPHRLAMALQADNWWVRDEIVWAKKNTMPESVRDRTTKAHEFLFLLTKSPRYYFDAEAIKEPMASFSKARLKQDIAGQTGTTRANGGAKTNGNFKAVGDLSTGLRNKRSVWHVATRPFKEAHFATFPPDLIEPCILAGTSAAGVCAECGAPWRRQVRRTRMVIDRSERTHDCGRTRSSGTMVEPPTTTTGWKPGCGCYDGLDMDQGDRHPVPATVLDAFFGAGTTALVAEAHGRRWIGCELNPDYVAIAERRIAAARPSAPPLSPALLWLLAA